MWSGYVDRRVALDGSPDFYRARRCALLRLRFPRSPTNTFSPAPLRPVPNTWSARSPGRIPAASASAVLGSPATALRRLSAPRRLTTPDVNYPAETGGKLLSPTSDSRVHRLLSASNPFESTDSGIVYMSLLLQTGTNAGYRAFEMHNGGNDDAANRTLQIGFSTLYRLPQHQPVRLPRQQQRRARCQPRHGEFAGPSVPGEVQSVDDQQRRFDHRLEQPQPGEPGHRSGGRRDDERFQLRGRSAGNRPFHAGRKSASTSSASAIRSATCCPTLCPATSTATASAIRPTLPSSASTCTCPVHSPKATSTAAARSISPTSACSRTIRPGSSGLIPPGSGGAIPEPTGALIVAIAAACAGTFCGRRASCHPLARSGRTCLALVAVARGDVLLRLERRPARPIRTCWATRSVFRERRSTCGPSRTMPAGFNNVIDMTHRPVDTRMYVATEQGSIFVVNEDAGGNTTPALFFNAASALQTATGRIDEFRRLAARPAVGRVSSRL